LALCTTRHASDPGRGVLEEGASRCPKGQLSADPAPLQHAVSATTKRVVNSRIALAIVCALGATSAAHADLVVPAGGQFATGGSQTDLACTDVVVAGTLLVAGGSLVNVRHLTIQPGGSIDAGSGEIQVGGDWRNGGTFTAGTSTVRFTDACGLASGAVEGSTAFFNARFVSTIGKNHLFQPGSTQGIGGLLEILGTAGNPIQLRSSTPGQVANINLLPVGTQSILHVGVTDVWATGQPLAPGQANEGGGGNASNWFGASAPGGVGVVTIPTLGELALLALCALLAGIAVIDLRRRRPALSRNTRRRRPPSRKLP